MEEFEEDLLEPFPLDGMVLPRLRLTLGEDVPYYQIKVGPQAYEYVKSYPIKGHSATLPKYVREQMNAGRKALIIERPTRFLVYLDIAG